MSKDMLRRLNARADLCNKGGASNMAALLLEAASHIAKLDDAFDAACAFIDCHAGDPDITDEMMKTFAEFNKHRAVVRAAASPGAGK